MLVDDRPIIINVRELFEKGEYEKIQEELSRSPTLNFISRLEITEMNTVDMQFSSPSKKSKDIVLKNNTIIVVLAKRKEGD